MGVTALRRIGAALDAASAFVLRVAALGLLAMTAVVAWQVYARYVLNDTPAWADQTALLLMGWFVFLGAAVGVREGYHLGLVFVLDRLPRRLATGLRCLNAALVGVFGGAMVVHGGALADATWGHVTPTLGIPAGVGYLAFVVAGALIALFSAHRIASLAVDRAPPRARDAQDDPA